MTVAVIKTKAEQALAEQFRAVEGRLPGSTAVKAARASAMASFNATGLPHRRIEAWKYTDLRSALAEAAPPVDAARAKVTAAALKAALGAFAKLDADRIVFIDGVQRLDLSSVTPHSGITVQSLASVLVAAPADRATALLGQTATATATDTLNSAFVTDGAIVTVAASAKLVRPLMLVHACSAGPAASSATRHHLVFGAGSQAHVIELFVGLDGAAPGAQINAATVATVGDRADVRHTKVTLGHQDTHLSNLTVTLGAGTVYRGFQYTESPALARNDVTITYAGPGAKLDFSGAFLATGSEHIDTTLVVDHAVPACESRELFKGVLAGRGRGVFQGKIMVRQIAQKTDGKQMAQALMLSPDAEFDSKPELEIYADDVICGHGATVIDLDQDQIFYLRARGIPLVDARALLVQAFIGEALDKVQHEPLRDALMARATAWLAKLDV